MIPTIERVHMSSLYPPIEPYSQAELETGDGHTLYYECSGNPDGKPVIFLHGGPGSGCLPVHRQFFDPEVYNIVLLDQRGCGKSCPHASLKNNTTRHLVEDLEKLRETLAIEQWQVFGGSWGSTLALAYAQSNPERVTELVLRGIFMFRQTEIDWLYKDGASRIFPEFWQEFAEFIPEADRHDLISAYYDLLTGTDDATRLSAARSWALWEHRVVALVPSEIAASYIEDETFVLAYSRIEAHYFVNKGFLDSDDQLLRNAPSIDHIPTVIVHGRYDAICPAETAWTLSQAMPSAELVIVPTAGHSIMEPGITEALIMATKKYR